MITIFTAVDLESRFRNIPIEELVTEKHLFSWSRSGQSEFAIYSDGKSFFVIKSRYEITTREVLPMSVLSAMLYSEICTCDYPYGKISEDVAGKLYLRDTFVIQRVNEIMAADSDISKENAFHRARMETIRGNLIDPEVEQKPDNPPGPEKPWRV